MPTVVVKCNSYNCIFIARTGNLCCAEEIEHKGTVCITFRREAKAETIASPNCHRENGKWKVNHYNLLK